MAKWPVDRPAAAARWNLRSVLGLGRSIAIYYLKPRQGARLRQMYRQFVPAGGLCFDIGAHVGNRTRCFRALGARVVAVEPQPRLVSFLRWLFRDDANVTVLPMAVGASSGVIDLKVSSMTPTVSTASATFRSEVANLPSFRAVRWDEEVQVPMTTLDELVALHGLPDFIKIDVEGMEDAVLHGLTHAVPSLSFEVLPAHKDAALRAISSLRSCGPYVFNVSLGETMRFIWSDWVDAAQVESWIGTRASGANSGDVYAVLRPSP